MSDMSAGLNTVGDALYPPAAAAQEKRLHICGAEVGRRLQASRGINPPKMPLGKKHISYS